MGNTFTIASLKEEVERKFAPMVITLSDESEVSMPNLLRMDSEVRTEVIDLMKEINEVNDDDEVDDKVGKVNELINKVIVLVADRPGDLIKELGDDVQMSITLLDKWMESTQPGEAQNSPN